MIGRRSTADPETPLPWRKWADGRVWRLRRGHDFHVRSAVLQEAAKDVAAQLGKGVRISVDEFTRRRVVRSFVWIQFVDAEIPLGSECPCGEKRLLHSHPTFATCPTCGRLLGLKLPKEDVDLSLVPHLTTIDGDDAPPPMSEEDLEEVEQLAEPDEPSEKVPAPERAQAREEREARRRRRQERAERSQRKEEQRKEERTERSQRKERRTERKLSGQTREARQQKVDRLRNLEEVRASWLAHLGPGSAPRMADERLGVGDLQSPVFIAAEQRTDREIYYGHALGADGAPALVVVAYPLVDGARIAKADSPDEHDHGVWRWPLRGFDTIIELPAEPGPTAPGPWPRPYRRSPEERRRTIAHRFDLGGWADVEVVGSEQLQGRERRYGIGLAPWGERGLIAIDIAQVEGEYVDDADAKGGHLHCVFRWPLEPFAGVIRLDSQPSA